MTDNCLAPRERIAVLGDDPEIAQMVEDLLRRHDLAAMMITRSASFIQNMQFRETDLLVVGLNRSDAVTYRLCLDIRCAGFPGAILLIANDPDAIPSSADCGAVDSCVAKPFQPAELVSQIRTMLALSDLSGREGRIVREAYFRDWKLDLRRRVLVRADTCEYALSAVSYNILVQFLLHPGQPMSSRLLATRTTTTAEAVSRQVANLRSVFSRSGDGVSILTTLPNDSHTFTPDLHYN